MATATDSNTDVIEDTRLKESEPGDHDTFAHYVRKEHLERAIFDGVPIRALCGKMWLPTKDFSKFPVCPTCKEIWESLSE